MASSKTNLHLFLLLLFAVLIVGCDNKFQSSHSNQVKISDRQASSESIITKIPVAASSDTVKNKGTDAVQTNGKLDVSGNTFLQAGDVSILINATDCKIITDTLSHCTGKVELLVKHGITEQKVVLDSLFFDSTASLYRGSLGRDYKMRGHSIVLSDVNGDALEDLLVWTGKEGNYGGPSFDVYLMDKNSGKFQLNEAFSELTVGYSALFIVEKDGKIKAGAANGCCEHYFDTYEVRNNAPVLIERISEDTNNPAQPKVKKEILIDGKMKEVSVK